jgi:hypothetical protein
MPLKMRPVRRVVTGNDNLGRSGVLFDSDAPNVNIGTVAASAGMTDVWVYHQTPAPVSGERDDGNLPFAFDPPAKGGHLRIVQSAGKPADYRADLDTTAVPLHEAQLRPNGHTWDRGGQNAYSSPVHQSETIDYGVMMSGKRTLILDDGLREMLPGDTVVQLANWHGWTNPNEESSMAFIMMGGVPRAHPPKDKS